MWPKRVVTKAHAIFKNAASELSKLGKNPKKTASRKIIKRIVDEFNELDRREECMETTEREEVVLRIEELAGLVGLDNTDEQLTGHRDW